MLRERESELLSSAACLSQDKLFKQLKRRSRRHDDFPSFAAPPTLTRLLAGESSARDDIRHQVFPLLPDECLATPRVHSALFEMRYWN